MKKPRVLDRKKWVELFKQEDDPLIRELTRLMFRYGQNEVINCVSHIDRLIFVPQKLAPGAKTKWPDGPFYVLWIDIEIIREYRRRKGLPSSVDAVTKQIFKDLRGKPYVFDKALPPIRNAETLRKKYQETKKSFEKYPFAARRYERILERWFEQNSSKK